MSDVLLINSPVKRRSDAHAALAPPLGLSYIAAVLAGRGFDVSAVDLNVGGFDPVYIARIIEAEAPKILGLSAQTETYLSALQVAALAKEIAPQITVVMGGPHPTILPRESLRETAVDFVVVGEGEVTMLELTDAILNGARNLAGIKGIAYRCGGRIRFTPERPFIEELDALPFPRRDLFPDHLYKYPGTVLTSRGGCPFNCSFCAVNNIWRGQRRFRSPESVAAEVRLLLEEFGPTVINIADDAFTLNRKHAMGICAAFEGVKAPFPWTWSCSTRVDLVNEELLASMRAAGCESIQFGVESGSQAVLDSIGKRIRLEEVRRAVALARRVGLEVLCSFMFPHPGDTEESIRAQAKFMSELMDGGAEIGLSFTTPYPGTYLNRHAADLGINILADSWDEYDAKHLVLETRSLSEAKLKELFRDMVSQVGLMAQ